MATTRYSSKTRKVAEVIIWVLSSSSCTPMTLTRVVFLSITLNSLPSGGMITRSAWGSTMRRISLAGVMPRERAASYWPRSTAPMPARMISAM